MVRSIAQLGVPVHTLFYEELQNEPHHRLQELVNFVTHGNHSVDGPMSVQQNAELIKHTSDDLEAVLENYWDIHQAIASGGPPCLLDMLEAKTSLVFPNHSQCIDQCHSTGTIPRAIN